MPRWSRCCGRASWKKEGSFVGGSAASIFSQDAVSKVGNSSYSFGVAAHYEQLYFKQCI